MLTRVDLIEKYYPLIVSRVGDTGNVIQILCFHSRVCSAVSVRKAVFQILTDFCLQGA